MATFCQAYTYSKPGPPEKVLELNRQHRVPNHARPNEVLVKVEAAALNPVDCECFVIAAYECHFSFANYISRLPA